MSEKRYSSSILHLMNSLKNTPLIVANFLMAIIAAFSCGLS